MTVMDRSMALVSLLAGLVLTGCGGVEDTPLPDYLERLGRSLDVAIDWTAPAAPALPRARDLDLDIPLGSLDLLDMLTLSDCRLNVTIGKSNSGLGKIASASQRLLLELEFLELAPGCIATLRQREELALAATLARAVKQKREELPGRIWNATLGGPEFRRLWKPAHSLSDYPATTGPAVPAALSELAGLVRAWLAGDFRAGVDRLEPLLDVVRRGDGGSLLSALGSQRSALTAATAAVQQRLQSPPLCFRGTASPDSRVFETVVRKYFIGEVQPWSVALDRRRRALEAPVTDLETALADVIPDAYHSWRRERDAVLAASTAGPRRHAQAIGEVLESCGLRPGGEMS